MVPEESLLHLQGISPQLQRWLSVQKYRSQHGQTIPIFQDKSYIWTFSSNNSQFLQLGNLFQCWKKKHRMTQMSTSAEQIWWIWPVGLHLQPLMLFGSYSCHNAIILSGISPELDQIPRPNLCGYGLCERHTRKPLTAEERGKRSHKGGFPGIS